MLQGERGEDLGERHAFALDGDRHLEVEPVGVGLAVARLARHQVEADLGSFVGLPEVGRSDLHHLDRVTGSPGRELEQGEVQDVGPAHLAALGLEGCREAHEQVALGREVPQGRVVVQPDHRVVVDPAPQPGGARSRRPRDREAQPGRDRRGERDRAVARGDREGPAQPDQLAGDLVAGTAGDQQGWLPRRGDRPPGEAAVEPGQGQRRTVGDQDTVSRLAQQVEPIAGPQLALEVDTHDDPRAVGTRGRVGREGGRLVGQLDRAEAVEEELDPDVACLAQQRDDLGSELARRRTRARGTSSRCRASRARWRGPPAPPCAVGRAALAAGRRPPSPSRCRT